VPSTMINSRTLIQETQIISCKREIGAFGEAKDVGSIVERDDYDTLIRCERGSVVFWCPGRSEGQGSATEKVRLISDCLLSLQLLTRRRSR
jgi:hypothetical protein